MNDKDKDKDIEKEMYFTTMAFYAIITKQKKGDKRNKRKLTSAVASPLRRGGCNIGSHYD